MRQWAVPRAVAVAVVVVSSLVGSQFVGWAQVDITLERVETRRVTIALAGFPEFRMAPGGRDLAAEARKILLRDLAFSGIFDVIPESFLHFDARAVAFGDEAEVLPSLNRLRVQALLVVHLSERGREITLEGRLYKTGRGTFLMGKRYYGDPKALRTMVHRLADETVLHLTGERGVANTRIAYVAERGGAKEIYLMDYDGMNRVLVTGNRSINLSPRFSPDGKFLAYTSYRDGNPDLYLLNLDTGRRVKVSAFPGLNISPAWSPDGQWLALSMSKNGGAHISLMRKDGTKLRRLTRGTNTIAVSPTFSPNGRQIAFTSDRGGTPQIYVMDVGGTNLRRLTFDGAYNASPRWSPRGDKIAFVSNRDGSFHIYLMNPDGSRVQKLTTRGTSEDPAWSPNGRHIIFTSTRTGRKQLYVMHADGSGQQRLTQGEASYFAPDWSP
ncbi:MAG: Tol-Pal system beta propeller repeat protein TolB [Candidatus Methylomirabilales bacterium]